MISDAVSLRAEYLFTAVQVGVWVSILSQLLPDRWLSNAAPLLFLVWLYPFTKCVTDYAQVMLGITLGWGVPINAAVLGIDVWNLSTDGEWDGLAGLYLVYVTWAIIHDTVYAHQDVRDDLKAGIKSIAVRLLHRTKALLWVLAVVHVGLLGWIGARMQADMWYYLGAIGGNTLVLVSVISQVNLSDPQDCLSWFQAGSLLIGASIVAGLWGEYIARM